VYLKQKRNFCKQKNELISKIKNGLHQRRSIDALTNNPSEGTQSVVLSWKICLLIWYNKNLKKNQNIFLPFSYGANLEQERNKHNTIRCLNSTA
jgi:hypothetical protein